MQQPDPALPTTALPITDSVVAAGVAPAVSASQKPPVASVTEIGGRDGPEPTRFGDWERNGRCIDF